MLGLVADPGPAAHLVASFADELPERIAEGFGRPAGHDGDAEETGWKVETSTQLLPLDDEGVLPLKRIGEEQKREHGWDLTIVVTELPRRAGKSPILADYAPEDGVALVSVPALGAFRVASRARDAIVHLVAGHFSASIEDLPAGERRSRMRKLPALGLPYEHFTGDEVGEAEAAEGRGGDGEEGSVRGEADGQTTEQDADEAADQDTDRAADRGEGDVERGASGVGEHLVLTGFRGRVRLLSGMVRANRPWRLVPSLSPALAGAAAGAAFGVFYSNIWMLADAFSVTRLALVNALAVLAMIAWLILDNNLWERRRNRGLREEALLYNLVTLVTVSFGVLCMYVLLFAVTLVAAFVAIPGSYMEVTLKHATGLADFGTIAWLSASMGTLAGALGSGLAGESAVRRAAYSVRERERQARRSEEDRRRDREATPAEAES